MPNYWITTHWPPEIGSNVDYSIYLFEGKQKVGSAIKPGDRVWIYESRGGRKVVRKSSDGLEYRIKRSKGKEGIIALAEVRTELRNIGGSPEKYEDGSERWWRWKAGAQLINRSGYVSRQNLNKILNYKSNNYLKGFGDGNSGLKKISKKTYSYILEEFNKNQPQETKPRKKDPVIYIPKGHGGGEGPIHKKLKEGVADNPAGLLEEKGLKLIQMEYPFSTGDRIDVLLQDVENRYITAEIEETVHIGNISGILQAIKYRHMYAVECRRQFEEIRSFLVVHGIDTDSRELCKRYGVEVFTVKR
jgi:hypothetical protein